MAAGFTILTSNALNAPVETSRATASVTPAVGDLAFWYLPNYAAAPTYQLTGADVTWTLLDSVVHDTDHVLAVFRATAGGGTAGVQTFADTGSDDWLDPCWAIVRPTDLTYVGVAGKGSGAAQITITITSESPAALLCYYGRHVSNTFNTVTDWTELLDTGVTGDSSEQLQWRDSDVASIESNVVGAGQMAGIVLDFSAAASGLSIPIAMRHYLNMQG